MPSNADDRRLPGAEPGKPGMASARSYAGGFWFGLLAGAWLLLEQDLSQGQASWARLAFGTVSAWPTRGCAVLFYFALQTPVSAASVAYYRATGRTFVEDRIGFAKAGGQDIGHFAGLFAGAVTISLFVNVVPHAVGLWLRVPSILLITVLLGNLLATVLARRVFALLFGSRVRGRSWS